MPSVLQGGRRRLTFVALLITAPAWGCYAVQSVIDGPRIKHAACAEAAGEFFPIEGFGREQHARQLRVAGEVPLCDLEGDVDQAYRFIWSRSFDEPMIVTIERSGSTHRYRATVLEGMGGYTPSEIREARSLELDGDGWRELADLFESVRTAVAREWPGAGRTGRDGARWIFEAVEDGRYWAVNVWSPEPSGSDGVVREAGIELVRFADLVIHGNIY